MDMCKFSSPAFGLNIHLGERWSEFLPYSTDCSVGQVSGSEIPLAGENLTKLTLNPVQ